MSFFKSFPAPTVTAGVSAVNSLEGDLTLAAGTGISITPSGGDTLTIAATSSAAPGGGEGAVQFNTSSAFDGDETKLVFDETDSKLSIAAAVEVSNPAKLQVSQNLPTVAIATFYGPSTAFLNIGSLGTTEMYLQCSDGAVATDLILQDAGGTTIIGDTLRLRNTKSLVGRNAADDTDLLIAKINALDNLDIGLKASPTISIDASFSVELEAPAGGVTMETDGFVAIFPFNGPNAPELQFHAGDFSEYAAIKAPATLANSYTLTLPDLDAAGPLASDGAGQLNFVAGASGSFITADVVPQTITVVNGIITAIV